MFNEEKESLSRSEIITLLFLSPLLPTLPFPLPTLPSPFSHILPSLLPTHSLSLSTHSPSPFHTYSPFLPLSSLSPTLLSLSPSPFVNTSLHSFTPSHSLPSLPTSFPYLHSPAFPCLLLLLPPIKTC